MLIKTIKKISKILLACSLLLTGAIINSKDVHANDIDSKAAVVPWTETETYVFNAQANGVYGGTITLDVTWLYTPYNGNAEMRYQSANCENQNGNTCSFTVSQSGESHEGSNVYYYVTFTINNTYNGKNYSIVYRITIYRNVIKSKTVISVTKK